MTYVTNKAKLSARAKSDLDVYFENLEEAYGNLPVPSDDWANVAQLLKSKGYEFDLEELEQATYVILKHYQDVAAALEKKTKYA